MNRKILLVSQDARLREEASLYLSRHGFDTLQAATGLEGLNTARAALPEVIVLDEELPDLDGPSVCGILRAQPSTREIPIILLAVSAKALSRTAHRSDAPQSLTRTRAADALRHHLLQPPSGPTALLPATGEHL
jgi:DNA-binding response OmpR family regulator